MATLGSVFGGTSDYFLCPPDSSAALTASACLAATSALAAALIAPLSPPIFIAKAQIMHAATKAVSYTHLTLPTICSV